MLALLPSFLLTVLAGVLAFAMAMAMGYGFGVVV